VSMELEEAKQVLYRFVHPSRVESTDPVVSTACKTVLAALRLMEDELRCALRLRSDALEMWASVSRSHRDCEGRCDDPFEISSRIRELEEETRDQ
jgi:hypothetical protein